MKITAVNLPGVQAPQPQKRTAMEKLLPATESRPPKSDRVDISKEATERLREKEQERLAELARVKEEAEAARAEAEATAEAFKVLMRCIKIAGRIIAGDIVPSKDGEYLMDNEPEMYQMAVAARIPKEDPEEFDSVLEDEEENGETQAAEGGGGELPAPPSVAEATPAPESAPVEVE